MPDAPAFPSPTIFLDRDGTVIVDKHYLCDPQAVELCPNAIRGLASLRAAGYRLLMITNQSGIGRGYFTEAAMHAVHRQMLDMLEARGVTIEAIFHCPHTPETHCDCRKPNTGMIERAKERFAIDMENSLVIGDKACDIEVAKRSGLRAALVKTGKGTSYDWENAPRPDWTGEDLLDLSKQILASGYAS